MLAIKMNNNIVMYNSSPYFSESLNIELFNDCVFFHINENVFKFIGVYDMDSINSHVILIRNLLQSITINNTIDDYIINKKLNIIFSILSFKQNNIYNHFYDEVVFYIKRNVYNKKTILIDDVSDYFCISTRKLQMIFKENGTTYRNILKILNEELYALNKEPCEYKED